MVKKTVASFLLLLPLLCCAQQKYEFRKDDWFVEGGLRYGHFLPVQTVDYKMWDTWLYGLDLRFGRQTNGRNAWERDYRCPRYGLGMRLTYFDGTMDTGDHLGGNMAVFLYFDNDIWSNGRIGFDYGLLGGLALWTRCDDYARGFQTNKFLGTRLNCHLAIELGMNIRLSENYDLYLRGVFAHSSNSGYRLPDSGVNTCSGQLGMRYHLYDRAKAATDDEMRPREKIHRHYLYISDGFGATETYFDWKLYFGNTFQIGYIFRFHPKFGVGGGFDYIINMEYKAAFEQYKFMHSECTQQWNFFRDASNFGTFAGLDFFFNRLDIHLAFGWYLYRGAVKDGYNYLPAKFTPYYERVGFRVHLGESRRWFVGMMMKLHAISIDYLEWTVGCNVFRR